MNLHPVTDVPGPLPGATGEAPRCWTRGGDALVYQHCGACDHRWYFQRDFCPCCGHAPPENLPLSGRGEVHATTLVHRAPSDEFRAIAPYRVVLVDAAEGFRLMGHGDPGLELGDRVLGGLRLIAGRLLPYFEKDRSE